MTDPSYLPPVRLEAYRERLVAELSLHFAHDHLDTAEFENRLDQAFRATSLAALDQLTSDLPALPSDSVPARADVEIAPDGEVSNRQMVVAVMSGAERKGTWTLPHTLDVLAVMGGVELDFREARFGAGTTEVNIAAIMGGVEIVVPPGIRVETSGIGLMGEFQSFSQHADPSAPLLRFSGIALMGGVEISMRLPGESKRDAKQRLREQRKELKAQRKRLGRGDG